jgi:NitT/TauT family transport system ATP-binding protein
MKGILYVTHSIEEAVLTADRIIIFGSNLGFIQKELKVDIPHPRNSQDISITGLVDEVYRLMTTVESRESNGRINKRKMVNIGYRLPNTEISELTGLLTEMNDLQSKRSIDLPDLADHVRLDVNDLFPIIEILSLLNLAKVSEGDITMTVVGKQFISSDIKERKILFSQLLIKHVPLARHIVKILRERPGSSAPESRFLSELEDHLSNNEAQKVFTTFIEWARYAEIIKYDANSRILSLDNTNT